MLKEDQDGDDHDNQGAPSEIAIRPRHPQSQERLQQIPKPPAGPAPAPPVTGGTAEATVKLTKYETPATKASIQHKSRAMWPGLFGRVRNYWIY